MSKKATKKYEKEAGKWMVVETAGKIYYGMVDEKTQDEMKPGYIALKNVWEVLVHDQVIGNPHGGVIGISRHPMVLPIVPVMTPQDNSGGTIVLHFTAAYVASEMGVEKDLDMMVEQSRDRMSEARAKASGIQVVGPGQMPGLRGKN